MTPWVLTLICALTAIGLWVHGRRTQRRHDELLGRLPLTARPGVTFVPLSRPEDPPPPPGASVTAKPIPAYLARRRPEGVWVVAGTWSEQPVEVLPSAAAADLLAYWMSCDDVCVTHEVRYLLRGETNPIAPQVNRRITALATQACMAVTTNKLGALPVDDPFAPLPPGVVADFQRDFAELERRRVDLEATLRSRDEP